MDLEDDTPMALGGFQAKVAQPAWVLMQDKVGGTIRLYGHCPAYYTTA